MYKTFGKRFLDLVLAFIALVVLMPVFLLVAIIIKLDAHGPVFYAQKRVKRGNVDFLIFKFRTMHVNADKLGLLTTSSRDPRITRVGYYLRKYKIDELPQFFNILIGDMSFVGPRAEVRKYVEYYTPQQMKVLDVKPGLTDFAVLEFYSREEELLKSNMANYENVYIDYILAEKNKLNLKYIDHISFFTDIKILFLTFWKIVSN